MVKMDFGILGRLFPCLFPVPRWLVSGSTPGGFDFRKHLFAVLRRSDRQTVRSTAQAVKTPYKAKYKRKRHKKIIDIDNYIYRCYALGNYKAVKGF